MKRILFIFIVVMICLPVFSQEVSITDITGKVEIKKANTTRWISARDGMKMDLSDTISTGFNSSAVLHVDSSTVSLKPLTRMTLDVLLKKEGALNTSLFLRVGAVRARVDNTSLSQNFNIQSPYSTASVRGTLFDFDGLRLDVYEGAVAFFQGPPERIIQTPAGEPDGEDGEEAPVEDDGSEVQGETLDSGADGEEAAPDVIAETGAADDALVLAMADQYQDETAIFVQAGNSIEITLPVVYIPPAEDTDEEPAGGGPDEDSGTPVDESGDGSGQAAPSEPGAPPAPVTPPPAPPAPPKQTNIIIDWSSN